MMLAFDNIELVLLSSSSQSFLNSDFESFYALKSLFSKISIKPCEA